MASAELRVEVAFSPAAGLMRHATLRLPAGSTVGDALLQAFPDVGQADVKVGVWGKLCSLNELLRDRDRVEVYRSLLVDPKEARRQRFQRQRASVKR